MSNLRKLIGELGARVEALDQSIDRQTAFLGEQLIRIDDPEIAETPIAEPYRKARSLLKSAGDKRDLVRRIEDFVAQLAELGGMLKEKQAGITQKEREIRTHFSEVGQASYRAWLDHEAEASSYKEMFTGIDRLEDDVERIEEEQTKIRDPGAERPLFDRALGGVRSVVLSGRLRARESQRARIFEELGKRVCESDFAPTVDDEALSEIMKPVESLRRSLETLRDEEQSLSDRKAKLLSELTSMGVKEGSQRKVRELEGEVSRTEQQLRDQCSTTGRMYLEYELHGRVTNEGINKVYDRISVLRQERMSAEDRMKRLSAAIEVKRIEEQVADAHARIERMRSEIRKVQDEIESLQQQLAQLEEEKKRQLEVRGEERHLLLDSDAAAEGEDKGTSE